ncbi:MAG: M28 family peptidase [Candidatus Aminicenantes bacterium]|nr:M28 family peptidase [Candidatus Aminicenantes bacterium]
MKRLLLSALILGIALLPGCGRGPEASDAQGRENPAPPDPVSEYARTITAERLKEHIAYLASDELEGRHSGTRGGVKAAEYLSSRFRDLGLKGDPFQDGSYRQKFRMVRRTPVDCFLESETGRADNWEDFMELYSDFSGEKEVELVWAGTGRDLDLEGKDFEGKLVAFFQGTPDREVVSNDFERVKIEKILQQKAAGTLLVVRDDPPFLDYVRRLKPYFFKEHHALSRSPGEALASKRRISISTAGAMKLLGRRPTEVTAAGDDANHAAERLSGLAVRLRMVSAYEEADSIFGENVLAYLEGTAEGRECLVLTAHYDHLGKSGAEIFNGAYDNAAGVASLLEIAEAFASAARDGHRPPRSIVFLAPDAEELGGLGSRFYLESPVFPLSDTLADINLDGIGREDVERPDLEDFVHLYLSRNGRADLRRIKTGALERLATRLRIEPRDSYAGSDHAVFEERLIPAVALTTGQPKDRHQPTDTADKIDYQSVRDIARLAFAMAWEIAFGERPIKRIISE